MSQDFLKVHFSLKDRVVSFVSEKLFRNVTYTARHGLIRGMKRKGGLGFLPGFLVGSSNVTPENIFLGALNLQGKVVFDVGGYEGMLTLFFARKAKAVITYEPHPSSFRRIQENLALNGITNVTVLNRAAGAGRGKLAITFHPLRAGAASGDSSIISQIRGSSPAAVSLDVDVVDLDSDIKQNGLPLPDFVKIDVEGMEAEVLRGMRETLALRHPALFLEIHGTTPEHKTANATQIVEFLREVGYSSFRHIESGTMITASDLTLASQGHIYCEFSEQGADPDK